VPPGGTGELIIRGETIMKEYWRNPKATAETLRDGWLHTADLATIDKDGYITLVDRMKDMIISGGRNIYSVEVENALAAHPAVAEIAIVSRRHEEYGETVVAVVNPMPGQTISLDELREFGAGRLSGYKLPRELIVRPFRGTRPGRCSSTCCAPTSNSTPKTKPDRQAGHNGRQHRHHPVGMQRSRTPRFRSRRITP
jgi:acyl-CoA synthetase (AMP-forming)/AMP-acid ligase II